MDIYQQLRLEEGVRHHAYQDSLGFWTIGVGRLIDARKGGGLSDDEIDYLLKNDVERVRGDIKVALPWYASLNEPRQSVLIEMAFQMGLDGLMGFVKTLEAVRTDEYATAATLMLASRWAEQTPERAQRMARQMETGDWQT